MKEITPKIVRELLDYNPKTGKFLWRHRSERWFREQHFQRSWNTRWAGKPALMVNSDDGYLKGAIFRKLIKAHRAAWAHYHGRWPTQDIDHIDGNKHNNRIENLRDVSRQENMRNVPLTKANKSGVKGVHWYKARNKWVASIMISGKHKHLGYFDLKEDAASARKAAERKYGFSERHGT